MKAAFYNISSNAIAKIWTIGISIIVLPIYVKIIGIEAYGLVGFYTTLVGSLSLLDLGLSSTLNREMARAKSLNKSSESIRNLVFSLECIYWLIGLLIGVTIFYLSSTIAHSWLQSESLPMSQVILSIKLMAGIIAFNWPVSIYTGGLMGMQKQVGYNIINIIMATLKSIGVIFVLTYFSPTIEAFFIWQFCITLFTVLLLRRLLWYHLPRFKFRPKFSKIELSHIWKFAGGMLGITMATFCLTQMDKIILSRVLSLSDFGFYNISWIVGTSLTLVVGVLGSVFLPKLTVIVARGRNIEIIDSFHTYNRLMISLVTPVGLFLAFYSREIIQVWMSNDVTSEKIWLAVTILSVGSIFNAFMVVPYYLMIAYGYTKFTIIQNVIASIILVPLLFLFTDYWGLIGATLVWLTLNLGYNLISLPLIHIKMKVLNSELFKTIFYDMGIVFMISLIVIGLSGLIYSSVWALGIKLCFFVTLLIIVYGIIILFNTEYRRMLKKILQRVN